MTENNRLTYLSLEEYEIHLKVLRTVANMDDFIRTRGGLEWTPQEFSDIREDFNIIAGAYLSLIQRYSLSSEEYYNELVTKEAEYAA